MTGSLIVCSTVCVSDPEGGPRTVDEKGYKWTTRKLMADWNEDAITACNNGTSDYRQRYTGGLW